jgi:hypothetical protein
MARKREIIVVLHTLFDVVVLSEFHASHTTLLY